MRSCSGLAFHRRHVLFECLGIDLVDDSILIEVSRRVKSFAAGTGQVGRCEQSQVGLVDGSIAIDVASQGDVQRCPADRWPPRTKTVSGPGWLTLTNRRPVRRRGRQQRAGPV